MAMLQTEFEFVLPKGYIDQTGTLHRKGTMRMATAMDEIAPLKDPRVRSNQAYLSIILLSRVVNRLGTIADVEITPGVMEKLFSSDLAYLQALYNRINASSLDGICPTCGRPLNDENATEEEAARAAEMGG